MSDVNIHAPEDLQHINQINFLWETPENPIPSSKAIHHTPRFPLIQFKSQSFNMRSQLSTVLLGLGIAATATAQNLHQDGPFALRVKGHGRNSSIDGKMWPS